MTLQASGAISLSQIQTEFGGANPISMSEYYSDGVYVALGMTGVPTSGTISVSQFFAKNGGVGGALNNQGTTAAYVDFTLPANKCILGLKLLGGGGGGGGSDNAAGGTGGAGGYVECQIRLPATSGLKTVRIYRGFGGGAGVGGTGSGGGAGGLGTFFQNSLVVGGSGGNGGNAGSSGGSGGGGGGGGATAAMYWNNADGVIIPIVSAAGGGGGGGAGQAGGAGSGNRLQGGLVLTTTAISGLGGAGDYYAGDNGGGGGGGGGGGAGGTLPYASGTDYGGNPYTYVPNESSGSAGTQGQFQYNSALSIQYTYGWATAGVRSYFGWTTTANSGVGGATSAAGSAGQFSVWWSSTTAAFTGSTPPTISLT